MDKNKERINQAGNSITDRHGKLLKTLGKYCLCNNFFDESFREWVDTVAARDRIEEYDIYPKHGKIS